MEKEAKPTPTGATDSAPAVSTSANASASAPSSDGANAVRVIDKKQTTKTTVIEATPPLGKKWPPQVVRVSGSARSETSNVSSDTSRSLKTNYTGPIIPPSHDKTFRGRTVVLCFDGTGDQ